jgi:CsoR family transcriptional regulator, copper-sensing transcriptional repressor
VPSDTYEGYLVPAEYPESVIDDIKKRALHRTKIIEGQLRGIEKMIENDDYCVDIITLSLAVQKSLASLNKLLVENHLRTHVTDMYEAGGQQREAAVTELVRIFELSNNRG